jgi:hypothetical protein
MPVQENATVTAVAGAGVADDWDRSASAGAEKWSGEARAYYRERTERAPGEGTVDVFLRRELILETRTVLAMTLDTDDVITFTIDGRAGTFTGRAKTIPVTTLAGFPPALTTSRVVLEDA